MAHFLPVGERDGGTLTGFLEACRLPLSTRLPWEEPPAAPAGQQPFEMALPTLCWGGGGGGLAMDSEPQTGLGSG